MSRQSTTADFVRPLLRSAPLGSVTGIQPFIVVQGSSRSWAGGRDYCLSLVDGDPVIAHSLKKLVKTFPGSRIVIAAPAFDKGGLFEGIVAGLNNPNLAIYYGNDDSPLKRIVAACASLDAQDLVLKMDALHCVFDVELALAMLEQARSEKLDCVKPPDDFPAQLSSEVYRYGALRDAAEHLIESDRNFEIHPRFYFFKNKKYKSRYARLKPIYDDNFLRDCRRQYSSVYAERYEVTNLAVPFGDMISFHYRHATRFLNPQMTVLDIACGSGFGAKLVAPYAEKVVGADLDPEMVRTASSLNAAKNISYVVDDVTDLHFDDRTFDAVMTFETFEHVDAKLMMAEIKRVLKPNGHLIMSTPQNCLGHIPICTQHLKEYSLSELTGIVDEFFAISHVDGIKAGTICIENDPIGANTFLVAQNSRMN